MNNEIPVSDLPENELIALLHRLEELARREGLRESPTVVKIPTATQQELDTKANVDAVFPHTSVTGSRGGNAALANLLAVLDSAGIISDDTSA